MVEVKLLFSSFQLIKLLIVKIKKFYLHENREYIENIYRFLNLEIKRILYYEFKKMLKFKLLRDFKLD